ncbi:LbetaH domain-containing protein [Streptomyces sviceus]|uniref:hypothetical protein n=1 Tax=Streptomyces sviceus TaxID=285530 RepID=UPI0036EF9D4F
MPASTIPWRAASRTGERCYVAESAAVFPARLRLCDDSYLCEPGGQLGFNHSMAPDRPVFRRPLTSRGIRVGDDVWIGYRRGYCGGRGSVRDRDTAGW